MFARLHVYLLADNPEQIRVVPFDVASGPIGAFHLEHGVCWRCAAIFVAIDFDFAISLA